MTDEERERYQRTADAVKANNALFKRAFPDAIHRTMTAGDRDPDYISREEEMYQSGIEAALEIVERAVMAGESAEAAARQIRELLKDDEE